MNTKIIYSIAVLAVAALAAVNVRVNTQDNDLSDVSLANVEALAHEIGEYPCDMCLVNLNTLCFFNSTLGDGCLGIKIVYA